MGWDSHSMLLPLEKVGVAKGGAGGASQSKLLPLEKMGGAGG